MNTRIKGYIDKKMALRREFELISEDGGIFRLNFEATGGKKFVNGDILEFEPVISERYGNKAIKPVKVSNRYLEELKQFFASGKSFEAFVFGKNEGGFLVSYKGFGCFLPISETEFKGNEAGITAFLNTEQLFKLVSIESKGVFLTRKFIQTEQLEAEKQKEMDALTVGTPFVGTVRLVSGFGVFADFERTSTVLHISKIVDEYDSSISREEKRLIQKKMERVFKKGLRLALFVQDKKEDKYEAGWDKSDEMNRPVCEALRAEGLKA